ncbi:MAG TPA: K(+)-transporting ATPase subunit F [Cyanobacteria bacterium UBA11162]|nr:K(+)-transporting ATPase subunit F [Cyanobacteria bacterium UBA11162]
MKQILNFRQNLLGNVSEIIERIQEQWKTNPLPIQLFLLLCLNLVIAPAVDAATGVDITRKAAYALGILGMVIAGLCVYLVVVIFQPERF